MRDQLNALNALIAAQAAQIAALETALHDTAHNPNQSTLNLVLSDPPTRSEVILFVNPYNELLNQITRV